MKTKHILILVFSLLSASFLSAKVYADESSQTVGSNNENSPQINGDHNTICNNCNIYNSGTNPSVNQPNSHPKVIESSYPSTNSSGYKPEQSSPLEISTASGYEPAKSSPLEITRTSGYKPKQSPPLEISRP